MDVPNMSSFTKVAFVLGLSFALCPSASATETADFYQRLAAYHAPVVIQNVLHNPKADVFTRFDFDGDWNGDNNWKNLDSYRTESSVYYSVIETETHYFITYDFFYPRDYFLICPWGLCHENDFEGLRLTIEKPTPRASVPVEDEAEKYGTVWMLETQYHGALTTLRNPTTVTTSAFSDGFKPHGHVAVWSEGGKHGFHPANMVTLTKEKLFGAYAYGSGSPADGSRLKPYELTSLETLWEHRAEVGRGKTFSGTFNYRGARYQLPDVPAAFAGLKWQADSANPPWAWKLQPGLAQGDWFLDPAYSVCVRGDCPRSFSKRYLYHPFLGIRD
jgi:hypothetical protein